MSQFQNSNQFAQTAMLGMVDMLLNPNVIPVRIDPASVATKLQVAQAVKLVAKVGAEIYVDECPVDEKPYGFIVFSPKKNTYVAGDRCEIACEGSVIYLEGSAAINRGVELANDESGPTVLAAAVGEWPSLVSLGQIAAAGLIRCQVKIAAAVVSS